MKKLLCVVLCVMVAIPALIGCGTGKKADAMEIDGQSRQYIEKALGIVKDEWESYYSSFKYQTDKTIDVFNTRVIYIKENSNETFRDVAAVVEFDILSDWLGESPYYVCANRYDTVVFYKGGTTEAANIFLNYMQKTYCHDFSDVIGSIVECGDAYNTNSIEVAKPSKKESDWVEKAIETLKSGWTKEYVTNNENSRSQCDGTLKICNTRLVVMDQTNEKYEQYFGGIEAVVIFELQSDYMETAPYYINCGRKNAVFFHTDGSRELKNDSSIWGKAIYEENGIPQFFSKIDNLGNRYNQTFNLLGSETE